MLENQSPFQWTQMIRGGEPALVEAAAAYLARTFSGMRPENFLVCTEAEAEVLIAEQKMQPFETYWRMLPGEKILLIESRLVRRSDSPLYTSHYEKVESGLTDFCAGWKAAQTAQEVWWTLKEADDRWGNAYEFALKVAELHGVPHRRERDYGNKLQSIVFPNKYEAEAFLKVLAEKHTCKKCRELKDRGDEWSAMRLKEVEEALKKAA